MDQLSKCNEEQRRNLELRALRACAPNADVCAIHRMMRKALDTAREWELYMHVAKLAQDAVDAADGLPCDSSLYLPVILQRVEESRQAYYAAIDELNEWSERHERDVDGESPHITRIGVPGA